MEAGEDGHKAKSEDDLNCFGMDFEDQLEQVEAWTIANAEVVELLKDVQGRGSTCRGRARCSKSRSRHSSWGDCGDRRGQRDARRAEESSSPRASEGHGRNPKEQARVRAILRTPWTLNSRDVWT